MLDHSGCSNLFAEGARQDQGDKLSIDCRGRVHPQSLHVQTVLQIIEALLDRIFVTIDSQRFDGVFEAAGEQCQESCIPADVVVDRLGVEGDLRPAFRGRLYDKELVVRLLMCCLQMARFKFLPILDQSLIEGINRSCAVADIIVQVQVTTPLTLAPRINA